jgi:hypothetical protein
LPLTWRSSTPGKPNPCERRSTLIALHSNFCLDSSTVENCVAECAGAYALGSLDDNGTMVVKYIGRADDNVKARLKAHAVEGRFRYFAFTYSTGANPAYEKE